MQKKKNQQIRGPLKGGKITHESKRQGPSWYLEWGEPIRNEPSTYFAEMTKYGHKVLLEKKKDSFCFICSES